MDFLADLRKTGFIDVASEGETGFNSSPKTRGVLVRARKPGLDDRKSVKPHETAEIKTPQGAEGISKKMSSRIDVLLQRAITLGEEKSKLINGISLRWCLSSRSSDTRRSSLWRPCNDVFD
ncbi:MAG: hypothetical protein WAM73_14375 [Desulfobacterales bacterium]